MKQIENQLTAGANGYVHNTLCVLGHILLNSTGQFSVYWFKKNKLSTRFVCLFVFYIKFMTIDHFNDKMLENKIFV